MVVHPPPKPAECWGKGLVACYHPIPKRIDMGMGWQKCGTCLYVREVNEGYWPPVTESEALSRPD